MSIRPERIRRPFAAGAVTGACLVALFGASQAHADYTAKVTGTTLQLTGDKASDKLALQQTPTTLIADVGEDGTADFTLDRSTFSSVAVNAGAGDDEVRVFNAVDPVPLTMDGGAGNDTLLGNNGAEVLIGGAGNDTLLGNNGAEVLIGGAGNDLVDGNIGADTARLGTGDDHFQWDPGDGSDTVDGEAGSDTLDFNGSNIGERIGIGANGSRVRVTRDVAAVVMDLGGMEAANVRALGGADTVTVDSLAGTELGTAHVDLDGFDGTGDALADAVVVNGTAAADNVTVSTVAGEDAITTGSAKVLVAGDEPALDHVDVATLGGADQIAGGVGFTGPLPVDVDGGDDPDTVTYKGTAAADTIGIARNGSFAAAFVPNGQPINVATEDLVVQGLGGGDDIAGQNGIATITKLTLDGGAGDDSLRGGDGADVLLGGSGNDLVDGNIGADTAQLGTGNDHFQWDPGDGSDTVEGESGADALDFNGSNIGEQIDVSANGSRARVFRNVAAVTQDFDGIERVNLRTLGGADNVTVGDLAGTAVATTHVDVAAFDGAGDALADSVTATGTDGDDHVDVGSEAGELSVSGLGSHVLVAGAETGVDTVNVAMLGGADTIASGVGFTTPGTISVDGGAGSDTATYSGSAAADAIGVARNGGAAVGTFVDGGGILNTSAVENLAVQGLGGDDAVSAQNGIGALTQLTLDGGNGNDTLRGGDGADVLLGGSGNDLVDGNIGADTAQLGTGNDHFQWDPGDGSDTVEGQGGNDVVDFNGSNIGEQIDVGANGSRVRISRNVAAVTMDVDGVEALALRVLGGVDQVGVGDLTGTALKTVDVDLAAFDGGGDGVSDTVTESGTDRRDRVRVTRNDTQVLTSGLPALTRIAGSEPGVDLLRVSTLGGDDDVTVAPDVADLMATAVDLGADES